MTLYGQKEEWQDERWDVLDPTPDVSVLKIECHEGRYRRLSGFLDTLDDPEDIKKVCVSYGRKVSSAEGG